MSSLTARVIKLSVLRAIALYTALIAMAWCANINVAQPAAPGASSFAVFEGAGFRFSGPRITRHSRDQRRRSFHSHS